MKNFIVIFLLSLLENSVFGADEMKEVTEGDSLTLPTGLTEVRSNYVIYWLYGSDNIIIAEISGGNFQTHDDRADGIFKGKLELDKQTGSLTIKDIRIKNSGDYQLDINSGVKSTKFSVIVYARLPTPAIGFSECAPTSAQSSYPKCVVQCSVQTMGLVTLSWYQGNNLVTNGKSDTCSSTSVRLEVDYYDKNTYSCMVSNPISNQTKHLVISGLCHTCAAVPDSGLSPGAVAGIVVPVLLVSVAAAAAVMYFCRPRTTNLPGQTWSVPSRDDVTLNPGTEIQTSDEIQWLHGAEETLIAEIRRETREMTTYEGPDGRLRDRLEPGETTGSLTIKYLRTKHTGLYTLKIRRGRETLYKRFFVSVEQREIAVMKGESVTLYSNTEIQRGDEMQWLFDDEAQQTVLAEIKTTEGSKYEGPDERFRDRLKLNKETGSLTITKFTAAHSGFYTLKIRRGTKTSYRRFFISVRVEIAAMEGESVTLNPDTEIIDDDLMQWMFRHEEQQTLIAEIKEKTGEFCIYDYVPDGRFRDRLKLDKTTGSLTITNTRTTDSGVYSLEIRSSSRFSEQTFIVTVKDEVEERLLKEDSVTLNPDTKIQRDDQILWMFGDQSKLIAQIRGETVEIYDDANKRFRDRLKLDETGSLTITNITTEHTGLYKLLTISSSRGILCKKFKVLIRLKCKTVIEGDSIHLNTGLTERQRDDEIQWLFGDEYSLIAEIKGGTLEIYDVPDRIFRDRLELNNTTGDLTIKNSTAEHAGRYKLKIRSREGKTNWTFIVIIRARKKSSMKEENDSRENRVNESATVEMPLLNGDDLYVVNEEDYVNVVNEEEGTSSL